MWNLGTWSAVALAVPGKRLDSAFSNLKGSVILSWLRVEPWASPVFVNTCNKRGVGGTLGAVVVLWLGMNCSKPIRKIIH